MTGLVSLAEKTRQLILCQPYEEATKKCQPSASQEKDSRTVRNIYCLNHLVCGILL